MNELKQRIHDENTGLDYVLSGDCYLPDIRIDEDKKHAPIGKWGRMHRDYLKENNTILYNHLVLTGRFWTYLADLDRQASERYDLIVKQMAKSEGVDENLKRRSQLDWVRLMNNIMSRAEEIVRKELIYL